MNQNRSASSGMGRLAWLDVLRFAAAGLVMVFHLAFWSWAPESVTTPSFILNGAASYPTWVWASWFGWVGVQIFFVISGFVIIYSARSSTAIDFMRKRFYRLYPAALICASFTAVILFLVGRNSTEDIFNRYVKTILFDPFGPWVDGVYWSLGVELAFYVVVFFLLAIKQFHKIEFVAVFIGLVSAVATVYEFIYPGSWEWYATRLARLLLLRDGVYFATGTLLWFMLNERATWVRSIFLAVFITCGVIPIFGEASSMAAHYELKSSMWTPVAVWLLSLMLIVIAVKRPLTADESYMKALRTIGLATYPIYLIHDVVGAAVISYLVRLGIEQQMSLIIVMLCVVGVSVSLTVHVETRMVRIFKRYDPFHRPSRARPLGPSL